jgi:thiol:disulfide interchange protein DsbA
MKSLKLALSMLISLFIVTTASAVEYQEGAAYQLIVPAQPTSIEGKIEVAEVFSYGCSHCYRFEPILERWLKTKPKNVEFIRIPAIFSPQLELYARAFYAAEALGALDKIHKPFFDAIHLQKLPLNDEAAIGDLFEKNGVSRADFIKAFRSFSVDAKMRRAAELGKRYGIQATPSMVVNGKYRLDPGMTGGANGMMNVVDYLAAKEKSGK